MDKREQKEKESVAHVFVFESCFLLFVNEVGVRFLKKRREEKRERERE